MHIDKIVVLCFKRPNVLNCIEQTVSYPTMPALVYEATISHIGPSIVQLNIHLPRSIFSSRVNVKTACKIFLECFLSERRQDTDIHTYMFQST